MGIRKGVKKLLKKIKDFEPEGDSLEYEILDRAVKSLSNPVGKSLEVGVRMGYSSKVIIDAYRKYHGHLNNFVHLGVDPYGDLPYNMSELDKGRRVGYDNMMKQRALAYLIKNYREFHPVIMEDTEFFQKFENGYPIYNQTKFYVNSYELVHFDGPHDLISILKEISFFIKRLEKETIFVFDDIEAFNLKKIEEEIFKKGFVLLEKGVRKASYKIA